MAKILNSSVFTNKNLLNVPSLGLKCSGEPLSYPWIVFGNSYPSKSGGPDNCHPRVFTQVKLQPLLLIFESSLEEGQLPSSWKELQFSRRVVGVFLQTTGL